MQQRWNPENRPSDDLEFLLRFPLFLSVISIGCTGSTFQYAGHDVYKYYPLDGDRAWEYANVDEDWLLQVDKITPTSEINGIEVITLEYSMKDPYSLLYSIDWSSSSADGVLIHGYGIESSGESIRFDSPIKFAHHEMVTGEFNTTDTNGYSFTSTFVAVETCYNHWTSDDWQCLHFEVTEESGSEENFPFLGEYWIATRWGTSSLMNQGDANEWVLTQGSYSSGEE